MFKQAIHAKFDRYKYILLFFLIVSSFSFFCISICLVISQSNSHRITSNITENKSLGEKHPNSLNIESQEDKFNIQTKTAEKNEENNDYKRHDKLDKEIEIRKNTYLKEVANESLEDSVEKLLSDSLSSDFCDLGTGLQKSFAEIGYLLEELCREPRVNKLLMIAQKGNTSDKERLLRAVVNTLNKMIVSFPSNYDLSAYIPTESLGALVFPLLCALLDKNCESLPLLVQLFDLDKNWESQDLKPVDPVFVPKEIAHLLSKDINTDLIIPSNWQSVTEFSLRRTFMQIAENPAAFSNNPQQQHTLQTVSDYLNQIHEASQIWINTMATALYGVMNQPAPESLAVLYDPNEQHAYEQVFRNVPLPEGMTSYDDVFVNFARCFR